jgi:hypothetical protein
MSRTIAIKGLIALALTTFMVLPFTNCGQYADPAAQELFNQSLDDCDDDCINPASENLAIKANVGDGTDYGVHALLSEFNIAGECNEAGYPTSVIRWELVLNGVVVRHSGMLGMNGSNPVNSRCVNGRYMVYVYLGPIAEDNVNRQGLMTGVGTNRAAYDLYLEIFAQRMVNDPKPISNRPKSRTRLSLGAT